jgi:hypothetical protein
MCPSNKSAAFGRANTERNSRHGTSYSTWDWESSNLMAIAACLPCHLTTPSRGREKYTPGGASQIRPRRAHTLDHRHGTVPCSVRCGVRCGRVSQPRRDPAHSYHDVWPERAPSMKFVAGTLARGLLSTSGRFATPLELPRSYRRGGRFATPLELPRSYRRAGRFATPLELPRSYRRGGRFATPLELPRSYRRGGRFATPLELPQRGLGGQIIRSRGSPLVITISRRSVF